MSSNIVIDTSEVNKVVKGLGEFEKQMPGAAISAVNRTLTHVNTRTKRLVANHYRVKISDVKTTITLHKARKGRLLAFLKSEGRRLTLGRFKFGNAKKSVKVKIKKTGGPKKVDTSPQAFSQILSGKQQIMKRRGKSRYPVDVLRSISIPQMIDSLDVSEEIQKEANKMLSERIEHEIDYRLKKVGAK